MKYYLKQNWQYILALCITPVIVCLLSFNFITERYIEGFVNQQSLKTKNDVKFMIEQITLFEKSNIGDQFEFTCKEHDRSILNSATFSPIQVRIAQLVLSDGRFCSNIGNSRIIETNQLNPIPGTKAFYSTSKVSHLPSRVMVIVYPLGEHKLIFMGNSAYTESQFLKSCKNCLRVDYYVDKLGPIERGTSELSTQGYYYHSATTLINDHQVVVTAGDRMYQWASDRVFTALVWVCIVLTLVLNIFLWLYQHLNLSFYSMIRRGIKNKEFVPFYQPIIDQRSGEVVGQEVLVRWIKDDEVHMSPNQFIPAAEKNSLIYPITEQLLQQVILDLPHLKGWVSINVIASMIENGHLSQWLDKHANHHTHRVCFEITERQPITHFKQALKEIDKVSPLCKGFKMDDFGTGYGGFNYLQELGVDSIKIDKMFIDTIGTDDLKTSVLDAIIAFGQQSNLEMIAEGVETQMQIDYLHAKGIHFIQGYFYAKPMQLDDLMAFNNAADIEKLLKD